MPASEESQLVTLLWSAAARAESRLSQQEIDRILGVEAPASAPRVPEQRRDSDGEAWSRIRTDAGDLRWLNHLGEPHCWELF